MQPAQFPYVETDPKLGPSSRRPLLPLNLLLDKQSITVNGLLDTGSMINVLPHSIGLQLGAVWDQQKITLALAGNLAGLEARALAVFAVVSAFPPVELLFCLVCIRWPAGNFGHDELFS